MRIPAIALTVLLACSTAFPQAATTKAQATTTTHPASIYVGANGKIYAYSLQSNGTVAAISGSPFTGASGSLAANSTHVYGASGTKLATYTRAANGALALKSTIDGTAHNMTPQGSLIGALTLDRSGTSLYAGEFEFDGADNNAYAAFRTTSSSLSFAGNTGINVDAGRELAISGNNQFLYGSGCYFANWDVFGFVRAPNGLLTLFDPGGTYPSGPDPNATYCPISLSASGRGTLAVSYASIDASPDVNLLIYQILANGKVEQIGTSITDIGTTAAGPALRFDPTGTYLAAGGQGGIQLYRWNANKTLTKVGKTVGTNLAISDLRWDNAGHLVATSQQALYVFTLKSGQLTWSGKATASFGTKSYPSLAVVP